METVFQLQPTSIVTKELFGLRCSLYPHNIKEVDLSEKAHKVKECACMILWPAQLMHDLQKRHQLYFLHLVESFELVFNSNNEF